MKLWKGIEKEGKFKGIKTLFIGSKSITFEEINKLLLDDKNIKQLYFGAGKCTDINENLLSKIIKHYSDFIITAEININKLHTYDLRILKHINIFLTFTNKNIHLIKQLNNDKTFIKIQTLKPDDKKFLSIGEHNKFIETNMDDHIDKIYKGDVVLK